MILNVVVFLESKLALVNLSLAADWAEENTLIESLSYYDGDAEDNVD